MSPYWPPEARSGHPRRVVGRSALPLALAIGLAAIGLLAVGARQRALQAEVGRLSRQVKAGEQRQRELEALVARQHAALQQAEGDLDTLRFQMNAVELQLDGVDYLSRELRAELGLPPASGTWEGIPADDAARGSGETAFGLDRERLALAQRRLAIGLLELQGLLDRARTRHADPPPGAADEAAPVQIAPPANWPARGEVTSAFGWRVFRGRRGFHTGIDIALDYGTPVAVTADGVVLGSGWQPGFGWSVFVQHALGYHTLYAHLSATAVRVGDPVRAGAPIGLSGSSGNSTGPHLHYEIWHQGQALDPRPFMDGTGAGRQSEETSR